MARELFADRVSDYAKFRSDYPPEIHAFLKDVFGIHEGQVIADVGSGTGLLTHWLLELGARVYGVEPNAEMRVEAEKRFQGNRLFTSVDGFAEGTGLPDASVDVVSAGNAFHWFNGPLARAEFKRILKPGGRVLLVRTNWVAFESQAMQDYAALVDTYCVGRTGRAASLSLDEQAIADFFAPAPFEKKTLGTSLTPMTLAQLKGRFLSTSFAPLLGHPKHEEAMRALEALFRRHQHHDHFDFGVICYLSYGSL